MKNIFLGCLSSVLVLLAGCESWLDVQPHDKISEESLFSTPQGFRNALNGVYIDLNKSALYGKSLTAHWLDVLAQSYNVGTDHMAEKYAMYGYGEDAPKNAFQSTWNTMYKQIGNINLFLANIESRGSLLKSDERDLLKGEALALRAMMHFDLFRLFGPVYITDSTAVSLPYYETYDGKVEEFLVANMFKDRVISDLNQAEALLTVDPVIGQGSLMAAADDGSVVNRYRGLRLNYYAVLALQARVALYVNMPDRALRYAGLAIEGADRWFPFAQATDWVYEPENPDRILSSECLFSLQNTKRNDLFRSNFEGTLTASSLLSPLVETVEALYSAGDWRLRGWWERTENENPDGTTSVVYSLLKYKDVIETSSLFNTMIPMIRRSEMHYIKAEVLAGKELLPEARIELENVLKARGIAEALDENLTAGQLLEEIRKEYRREFYGEGQLFFYYKRGNLDAIPDGTKITGTVAMNAVKYVLPLPESELQFRD